MGLSTYAYERLGETLPPLPPPPRPMRYETGQHSVGGGVLWSYMAIRHTPPTQNWERSFPHGSVSVKQIWAPWALLVVRPKFTICGEAGRGRSMGRR